MVVGGPSCWVVWGEGEVVGERGWALPPSWARTDLLGVGMTKAPSLRSSGCLVDEEWLADVCDFGDGTFQVECLGDDNLEDLLRAS